MNHRCSISTHHLDRCVWLETGRHRSCKMYTNDEHESASWRKQQKGGKIQRLDYQITYFCNVFEPKNGRLRKWVGGIPWGRPNGCPCERGLQLELPERPGRPPAACLFFLNGFWPWPWRKRTYGIGLKSWNTFNIYIYIRVYSCLVLATMVFALRWQGRHISWVENQSYGPELRTILQEIKGLWSKVLSFM